MQMQTQTEIPVHIAELERRMGLRPSRLQKAYQRGGLHGIKRGMIVYVTRAEAERYLATARRGRKADSR